MKKLLSIILFISIGWLTYSQNCMEYDTVGNYEKAFTCFMTDSADSYIQYKIGEYYYEGKAVPKNYDEAVKWFIKSADANNADGQNNLG